MRLGAFSISLAVADLDASKRFYEPLGFEVMGGDADASRRASSPPSRPMPTVRGRHTSW